MDELDEDLSVESIVLGRPQCSEPNGGEGIEMKKGKGQILNHSDIPLLVIETDTGPAVAHWLGPKMKSPDTADADGFKRADGETILMHKSWWKVPSPAVRFRADIFQIGGNFLMPFSIMVPVSDQWFGPYKVSNARNWGEPLAYVTEIFRDKNRRTIAYMADGFGRISKAKAVQLARGGKLDNVVVVNGRNGPFLRTKKNFTADDNLVS